MPSSAIETHCTFTLASDVTAGGLPSEDEIAKDLESNDDKVRGVKCEVMDVDREIYKRSVSFVCGCCSCVTRCAHLAMAIAPIRCSTLECSNPSGINIPLTISFFTALISFSNFRRAVVLFNIYLCSRLKDTP
jgi:hypothetical protein